MQACRKRGGRGHVPPHFLADQLTLFQPGGHIIPTQYYKPPRIFRPCDGPGEYIHKYFFFNLKSTLLFLLQMSKMPLRAIHILVLTCFVLLIVTICIPDFQIQFKWTRTKRARSSQHIVCHSVHKAKNKCCAMQSRKFKGFWDEQ